MKTIKRFLRRLFFVALLLLGGVVVVFIRLGDQISRFASKKPIDAIEETVVANLEDNEVAARVVEEFSLLKQRVNEGRVTVGQIGDLADEFQKSYEDGKLDTEEIEKILARVETLTK
ncbi:MAG: hypothetical protein WBH55_05060 [Bacteroidota bacterium]